MQVVSSLTMASLEKMAYSQGFKEETFMEKAGQGVAIATSQFLEKRQLNPMILLLCGKGNNGGDAFVAGRYLLSLGYTVVALQVAEPLSCSPLCQLNAKRFLDKGGEIVSSLENFTSFSVILDGLFGTGFKGQVKDPYADLITKANHSSVPILAIDIPSGLNGITGQIEGAVISATETLALGLPKEGFFLNEGWDVVGYLRIIDFGLPDSLLKTLSTDFVLLTHTFIHSLLPKIKRSRHKYEAGTVVGLAGSPGMPGAALLSSLASLRGGSGMVRLLHPEGMQSELSGSPYELIKIAYQWSDKAAILATMEKADATFVGPGIGRSESMQHLLKDLFPSLTKPCVIDADALTLLAEHNSILPKQAVLTPHTGEMSRLLKQTIKKIDRQVLELCQSYVETHKVTLVLKGAPTFILHPGYPILISPTGNPGMATAGSGDVLTGLIASLLSQGLTCHQAAAVGVYLHGLAGEYAAKHKTSYCLIASDLIHYFSHAYQDCLDYPSSM